MDPAGSAGVADLDRRGQSRARRGRFGGRSAAACVDCSPARSTSPHCCSSAASTCSGTPSRDRPASSCPASTTPRVCTVPSRRTCCRSWSGAAPWRRPTSASCATPTGCRNACCTCIGAALGIVGWIVLVAFTDGGVPTMLIFAVLWGVSSGIGAQAFYSLWASELFATPYRASAQGVMFFVVRTRHRPAELLLPDAARRHRPHRGRPAADRPARPSHWSSARYGHRRLRERRCGRSRSSATAMTVDEPATRRITAERTVA